MLHPTLFYCTKRALLRMSWNPVNLFNLASRPRFPDLHRKSVFQQRWIAKREVRAYFGPHITEKQFKRILFSQPLPVFHWDPQLHDQTSLMLEDGATVDAEQSKDAMPPMQMLSVAPFERRVDTIMFRACFVPSINAGYKHIMQGHVKVNGVQCREPSFLVEDGDIVSIHPSVLEILRPRSGKARELYESCEVKDYDAEDEKAVAAAAKKTQENRMARNDIEYEFNEMPWMSPWMFIPQYLEVDFDICAVTFLRTPVLKPHECEIPSPFPPRVYVDFLEFYKARRRHSRK